jgi:hypothetical protein
MGKIVIGKTERADSCGQVAPDCVPESEGQVWSRHSHDIGNLEKAK